MHVTKWKVPVAGDGDRGRAIDASDDPERVPWLFIHSSKVLASLIELIGFFIKCGFPYKMA